MNEHSQTAPKNPDANAVPVIAPEDPTSPAQPRDMQVAEQVREQMEAAQHEAQRASGMSAPDAEREIRKMSRRSFAWGAVAVAASYGGLRWINSRRQDNGLPWPLRRSLETSGEISRDLFSEARLAPEFSLRSVQPLRFNGDVGLGDDFDPKTWMLQLEGAAENVATEITLQNIKALPSVTMRTEFKCIEGWSRIVQFRGARLRDFIAKYPPATQSGHAADLKRRPDDLPGYVGLNTPDGAYYVGLEREAALHPQTLLCYEMNGQPLTFQHGAPLRLAIPVKYGVKSLKRIGTLTYSNTRPADYWAEQGYDYYAGH